MKLRVSTKAEAVDNFSGSSYISKSGIYDIIINFASVDVAASGAESVNFNIDYDGSQQVIYGPYVQNKDGNVNEIGAKIINALAIIAGMGDGDEYEIEEEEHAVGKDKKVQTFNVITNFSDLPVKVWVQTEWSINPNTNLPKKRLVIKDFFRAEDGASAKEIVAGKDFGKRLELIKEKYADNVTYRDGLTEEDIKKFEQEKAKSSGSNTKVPTAKAVKPKTASLFK